MLRQLIIGGAVSLGNIAIHAATMMVIIRSRTRSMPMCRPIPTLRLVGIMIATVSMLMAGASCRSRDLVGRLFVRGGGSARQDDLYFAFVNYTTLGYGDIIPVARWRLLGPLTAMNGVLLFGWSTAVIYHVLRASLAPDDERASRP